MAGRGWMRAGPVLLLAALSTLGTLSAAEAHASLVASEPADGSILDAAPERFSLRFSEPVSPFALSVVGPDGQTRALADFTAVNDLVDVPAPEQLVDGTYVLNWRIASGDGHPVAGSVIFSIGYVTGTRTEPNARELRVYSSLWLSKVAFYLGLFAGIGGVFARRILMPDTASGERAVKLALAVGAAGAVLSLGLQGLDAIGGDLSQIAHLGTWSAGFTTSYSRTVVAALAAFAIAFAGLLSGNGFGRALAWTGLLGVGVALALSGHASAAEPQWLMRPLVFLHASAIAVWIGALGPLGLAMKRREAGAAISLARFSRLVPAAVVALVVTGTTIAVVQVVTPAALVGTIYGRLLLVKLLLVVGLLVLAAANRWRLSARAMAGDSKASRALARSVGAEAALVLLILGVVAAWRFSPPPRALTPVPDVLVHIHAEPVMVFLTVSPGRVGVVDLVVDVLASDSSLFDAKGVTVELSKPDAGVEPFVRQLARHEQSWRAEDVQLPLAGSWTARVEVLVNDFEKVDLTSAVVIPAE